MKGVKIAVAVVCLALAAFYYFRSQRTDASEIPDSADSATTWMCRSCKAEFPLTARKFELEERRVSSKHDRGFGPLTCDQCKKVDAWRANRCPIHGIMFFVADVPGSDGLCPECKPARKAVQEEQQAAPEKKSVPLM